MKKSENENETSNELEIPEQLKGKPEEQWLKNIDILTKSDNFKEIVKLRYKK